jgi:hypothetical protein
VSRILRNIIEYIKWKMCDEQEFDDPLNFAPSHFDIKKWVVGKKKKKKKWVTNKRLTVMH